MSSSVGGGDAAKSTSTIISTAVKGSHVLKIDGYSQTKGFANGSFIKSRSFDIGGHRWYISYFPNGCSTDSAGWIEFSLYLAHNNATGAEASYTFSLLDDVGEPVQSYSFSDGAIRTFSINLFSGNGWGCRKFIQRQALEESTYLKDDCFSIKCDIAVSTSTKIRRKGASQFVTVPPSDLNQHIGRLLSSGEEADVTFQVGEATFAAHRLVLSARSSVIKAELLGPIKDANRHIRIEDMEPTVFRAMLHFIYTDKLPKMDKGDTFAMTQHLLVAADRYDMERLKLMCEHKLCGCISTSNAMTTLVLAEQHGCKGLREACFRFLKSPGNLKKVMAGDQFQHLTRTCPSLVNELLANVPR